MPWRCRRGNLVLGFGLSLRVNPAPGYWLTARRYFSFTTYNSLNQFLGFDVKCGAFGFAGDGWGHAGCLDGKPISVRAAAFVLVHSGDRGRRDAICLRLCAQGDVRPTAGLSRTRFQHERHSGSSTALGFSVVLDEGQGVVASSHNFAIAPINTDASNYGVHNFSSTFWLIWVSLTDAVTSN